MLDAIFWGLIQGLTEFLPISSSGHLALVPEMLGRQGPDLTTTALLHVGTLLALIVYFWHDLLGMLRLTDDGNRLLRFVAVGTIPAAVIGISLRGVFDEMNERPVGVAIAMIAMGAAMVATRWLPTKERTERDATMGDGVLMGIGQAVALIPGVSRSGATIGTGMAAGFGRRDAARLAFILGIPATAGAGLVSFVDLASEGGSGVSGSLLVGMAVAAIVGYASIAGLLRLIRRTGLTPFGVYCVIFGIVALVVV